VSRGPSKRFLDIEVALRWAYRDELPKRDRKTVLPPIPGERVWSPYLFPAGYGETSPMFREGVGGGPSGGYVDGWSRDPGFPRALGGPHVDALVIEEAVKELAAFRGHGFGADDPAGLTYGFEGLEIDHLQATVEAIGAMPGIIAVHARAGTRPTWSKDTPRPYPDNGGNGKPRVLIDEAFVQVVDVDNRGKERIYYEPDPNPPPNAIFYREPVPCPPTRKGWYHRRLLPAQVGSAARAHRHPARRIRGLAHGARSPPPGARGSAGIHRTAAARSAMAAVGWRARGARPAAGAVQGFAG
jgi:hypothetical protein